MQTSMVNRARWGVCCEDRPLRVWVFSGERHRHGKSARGVTSQTVWRRGSELSCRKCCGMGSALWRFGERWLMRAIQRKKSAYRNSRQPLDRLTLTLMPRLHQRNMLHKLVAGNKQHVAGNKLLVARNLLPRNKLRWCKLGFTLTVDLYKRRGVWLSVHDGGLSLCQVRWF